MCIRDSVWTVNSSLEAEEYLRIGIDSITTNKPIYIRNHLEKLNRQKNRKNEKS